MTGEILLAHDDEYRTIHAVPVTLRQVEAAGIQLDSAFGINDQEREELLDNPSILRLTFGALVDASKAGPYTVDRVYDIEALSGTLRDSRPRWTSCQAVRFARRMEGTENAYRIEMLVRQAVGEERLAQIMEEAARPHEEWTAERNQESEPDET